MPEFISHNVADTISLGLQIGRKLHGGVCIELTSDIGGGKTTLVKSIVEGLGSADIVGSPTFTVGKQYKAGSTTVYHYDFYRLADAGILTEELSEVIGDVNSIVIVEWGETVRDVLPSNRIKIQIDRMRNGEEMRNITVTAPRELSYIFEEVAV